MFYVSVGDARVDPYHSQPDIWGKESVFAETSKFPKTNEHLPPRKMHIDQDPEEDTEDPYTSAEEVELEK
jgi:hypothetical protein